MRKVLKTDLEGPASITINASNKPDLHFIQRPFPQSRFGDLHGLKLKQSLQIAMISGPNPTPRVWLELSWSLGLSWLGLVFDPTEQTLKGIQEDWNCCQLSCHHMESKYKNTNQRKEKTKSRERGRHPRAILWCSSCNQSGFCDHKTHYFLPLLKTNQMCLC